MRRKILEDLQTWLYSSDRKPLILRGARQTGKTWIVRELAKKENRNLIEINFERNPEMGEMFLQRDPKRILEQLEILYGIDIECGKTVVFLDEVQSFPGVLGNLRWFYEELPDLAVIAAGSLLEFVLEDHDFSMPVGRVSYMYMEPMSFIEFLWAVDEVKLADYIEKCSSTLDMLDIMHQKAMGLFRWYYMLGGMPAVIKSWAENRSFKECSDIQMDLIRTYRDDFNKYRKRVPAEVLRVTLDSVALQLGERFMYSRIGAEVRQPVLKEALNMLAGARLCRKITHTAANGLPLGAEIKENMFKVFMVDTGLAMRILGQQPLDEAQLEQMVWANKGALAEQMTAQLLYAGGSPKDISLYYWQQSGSGTGEIDFIIQKDGAVCPIEVKSGASGSMKSLHAFMYNKKLKRAYRLDTNKPSKMQVSLKTNAGNAVSYELVTLPIYMAELLLQER